MKWLALALLLLSCNREQRAQHEALAQELRPAAAELCKIQRGEGGGCFGDCVIWSAAQEGVALRKAGATLSQLAKIADPDTERMLADVRSRARSLHAALSACDLQVERTGKPGDDVKRCAQARQAHSKESWALLKAVDTLEASTEERTGVELPPTQSCVD